MYFVHSKQIWSFHLIKHHSKGYCKTRDFHSKNVGHWHNLKALSQDCEKVGCSTVYLVRDKVKGHLHKHEHEHEQGKILQLQAKEK